MKRTPSIFRRKQRNQGKSKKTRFLGSVANTVEASPIVRIWVRLNQSATIFALCIALVGFLLALQKNTEDIKRYDADRMAKSWDVLTRMVGKKANGGQVSAIERLVAHSISLDKVDLHDTYLANANLKGASLRGANLRGAILTKANLQGVDLTGADLRGATLFRANLGGAQMDDVDLSYAKLYLARVNISAILARDLTEADLTGVTFVYEDENGDDIWSSYADSIAESPEEENAQKRINSACANTKYNVKQSKELPIVLPKRTCKNKIDYTRLPWWEEIGFPNLTRQSSGTP